MTPQECHATGSVHQRLTAIERRLDRIEADIAHQSGLVDLQLKPVRDDLRMVLLHLMEKARART